MAGPKRPYPPEHGARVSEGVRAWWAEKALADPNCPPIKRARLRLGLTAEQAGKRAGLSRATVYAAERGQSSEKTLHTLSRIYQYPLSELELWPE